MPNSTSAPLQSEDSSSWIPRPSFAAAIVACYAALSGLWTFLSDWTLQRYVADRSLERMLETANDWLYVGVTALLFGFALTRYLRVIRRSALRLQAAEAELRVIGDNLPIGYVYQCRRGPEGHSRFTYLSAGVERVHGVTRADVLRDANVMFDLIDPSHRSVVAAAEEESARDLTDFELEIPMRRAGGETQFIHMQSRPRKTPEGIQWDGFAVDVTERKKTQSALRESEALFRALFDHSPDGILVIDDREMRILLGNPSMCRMLGYTPDELSALRIADIHPETAHERVRAEFASLALHTSNFASSIPVLCKDGSVFLADISANYVVMGGLRRTIGLFRDITHRKRAEDSLRESEERYRLLVENSQEVIYVAQDGRVEFVNGRGLELLGLDADAVLGRPLADFVPEADHKSLLSHHQQVCTGKDAVPAMEFRYKTSSARSGWLLVSAVRIDWGGRPASLNFATEITERKLIEDLHHIQHRLTSALAATSDFDEGLKLCLHAALDSGHLDCGGFYLRDEKTGSFNLRIHEGLSPEFIREVEHFEPDSPNARLVMKGEPFYGKLTETGAAPDETLLNEGVRFLAIIPFCHEGRAIGCLNAGSHVVDDINPVLRKGLETIAAEAAQAMVRLKGQAALQESLLFRREAEKIGRIGTWMVSPATDYLYWTEGVYEIVEAPLDYKPGLAEGLCFYDPESRPVLQQALERALRDGTPFELEIGLTTTTGKHLWTEVRGLRRMEQGGNAYVVGTFQDITDQRQAREALRAAEERYRSLVETSCDWVWEVDEQGRYTYTSPRVRELLGYSPEEVLGKTPFYLMSKEEAQRVGALFADIVGKRKPFSGLENTNRHKDGRLVVVESSGAPKFGPDGSFIGYHGMDRDITERKHLEAQFRQVQKLEAVGQLAGGVAHDFNNILAAILMQIGLLRHDPNLGSYTREALKELEVEAQRAATLTRQLLMFSRRSVLDVKVIDVNDVVEHLLRMLRRLIGEQVELQFLASPARMTVEADAGMLEQVLMNLAVNARDAMLRGGRITIATRMVDVGETEARESPERRPGKFVCLSVADTGSGMDEGTLRRIFDPFFTTKEAGRGTGLGLATVHGIVGQHKGWIEVESEIGTGTEFRILLPAVSSGVSAGATSARGSQVSMRGHETILLVEDEPTVRKGMSQFLSLQGYRLLEAKDAKQALAAWEKEKAHIDLLLTDMVLPGGLTGSELCQRFQSEKPGLKVIISSGYSSEISEQGRPSQPGVVYLPKPYHSTTLGAMLRSLFDNPAGS